MGRRSAKTVRWAAVAVVSLLIHVALLAWLGLRAPRPDYGGFQERDLMTALLSPRVRRPADPPRRDARATPAKPRSLASAAGPHAPQPVPLPPAAPPTSPTAPDARVTAALRAAIGCAATRQTPEEQAACRDRLAARASQARPLSPDIGIAPDKLAPWSATAARQEKGRRAWHDVGKKPGVWKDHLGKELPPDRPMPTKNDPKGCVAVVCEP